jgi:hypothetical protein
MNASFTDLKRVKIENSSTNTIRVRDVAKVFDKLPNGAVIQALEFSNIFGISLTLQLDKGTIGD